MNAPYLEAQIHTPGVDTEGDLHAALLARFQMTTDKADAVYELMQRSKLSFCEAALHLGFVNHDQVEDALAWVRGEVQANDVGLIEAAMRKAGRKGFSDRQVVVHQGDLLKPGLLLSSAMDSENPRCEKIRALRTELLLLSQLDNEANTLSLLSPSEGEGRSQLTAELAISFSQLGRRTLLVDTDLRRPTQHLLFGGDNRIGLTDVILQNGKPRFHPIDGLPHLSLLTSGTVPVNPLEMLSDGRFARLLDSWRKSFDFILLDTPPVSQYADGLAIATLARRVLVVSRAQHTGFKDARELLRRLGSTQSRILGAVINHF